ncbi:unnamed protein product, partial [Allacma fusca]
IVFGIPGLPLKGIILEGTAIILGYNSDVEPMSSNRSDVSQDSCVYF